MKTLLSLLLIMLAYTACADNRTRTTRRHLKPSETPPATETTHYTDSITIGNPDSLSIHGYDKPLRSTQETFFLTNRHSRSMCSVKLHITYFASGGEMLHSRDIICTDTIPARETRQIHTKAWDRQKAYYYMGTRVTPRSAKAIPYYPVIEIKTILLESPE